MSEEMCVDVAMDENDRMSRKMNSIVYSGDQKASDGTLSERGLLKKCEKVNESYKFVTSESVFVKEFSDKQEDLKYKSCYYRPKLAMIADKTTGRQRLVFVINTVKQQGKNDTITDIDINSICTKYYTLSDDFGLDLSNSGRETLIRRLKNHRNTFSSNEKAVDIEKAEINENQQFKLGKTSLGFDSDGLNFSIFDDDLIRLIYSELKPKFRQMLFSFENYIDDNEKFIAVLYSGGKDSTCRVMELLNKGYNVLPLVNTFNSHNVTDLLIRDIAVIYNLYHIFKNRSRSFKGKLYQPRFLSFTSFIFDHDYSGLNQQPYNIVSLSLLGKEFYKRCMRIEMCLIGGDIGVSYIPELKRLYNAALRFNCSFDNSTKTFPPLTFPYIKRVKLEIKDFLNSQLSNNDNGRFEEYFIPTCQEISIRNVNLQYRGDRCYLIIRFRFCGRCFYCLNYLPKRDTEGIDIAIPLKEISFNDTQKIVLHDEDIYKISLRFAKLFSTF
jgi:hypothetical protein